MRNNYEEKYFTEIINKSINYTDVCRKLNVGTTKGNRDTIKKYISLYKLDINHFYIPHNYPKNKIELSDILVEYSNYIHTTSLKSRLYSEGLKERQCELCGQGEEWRGKKMSLILDHENGVHNDNRIENLRIVCPNCNATLDTHGGKNKGNFKSEEEISLKNKLIKNNMENERLANNGKTLKQIESAINQRKIKRPDKNLLLKEVNELGYSGTGRKYGVSDNAIRKWIK